MRAPGVVQDPQRVSQRWNRRTTFERLFIHTAATGGLAIFRKHQQKMPFPRECMASEETGPRSGGHSSRREDPHRLSKDPHPIREVHATGEAVMT
jgi:hypothetical protein